MWGRLATYRVFSPFWGRRQKAPIIIIGLTASLYLAFLAATANHAWTMPERFATGYAILAAAAVAFALARWFQRASWINGLLSVSLVSAGAVLMPVLLANWFSITVDATPILAAAWLAYGDGLRRRIDGRAIRFFLRRLDFRRSDPMLRQIVQNSFVGILMIDGDGKIDSANAAVEKMFGYDTGQIYDLHARHLFYELFERAPSAPLHQILRADDGAFETIAVRRGGKCFPVELTVSHVKTENGEVFTAFLRDLTIFKHEQAVLEHQALHDPLTGLPNRTLFSRHLRAAIEKPTFDGAILAVMLLDLDRFKEINDTLGHPVGDRLLNAIARRLSDFVPDGVTFARFGGDEFGFLMPTPRDAAAAEGLAQDILTELQAPFDVDGISLEVGGSIGITLYPEHAETEAELIQRADVAMYAAKRKHSGCEIYDAEKDLHSLRHLTLTGDLRRAVKGDELLLHYQPKVDFKSGRLCGVEALVRWQHAEHGFMPPDDFVGHAEQTGLIVPLTTWVLDTALQQYVAWRHAGLEIDIAVNLSPRLLHFADLAGMIEERMSKWRVPPHRLILEVTENALMLDPARAKETLQQLRDLGIRIAIDDFGTGYSSLGYLKALSAEELKIDKSFVVNILEDASDRTIVASTIDMAHNLGLKVVAEGIESAEAMQHLKTIGCDVGQGFYIGRPMDADAILSWHEQWSGSPLSKRRKRTSRVRASDTASVGKYRRRKASVG